MSPEFLGLILLGALLTSIFIGFPIAFTLIILAVVFGFIGFGNKVFYLMVYQTIGLMKEETLAAVPLFVFMGHMMEEAGLMERLFKSFQSILGGLKGSLFIDVLLTATVFGHGHRYYRRLGHCDGPSGGPGHDEVQIRCGHVGRCNHSWRMPRDLDPAPAPRRAVDVAKGDSVGVHLRDRAAGGRYFCGPGEYHRRVGDAYRGCRHGLRRCGWVGDSLQAADDEADESGCFKSPGDLQYGPVSGRGLQRLRVRVCPSGIGFVDYRYHVGTPHLSHGL